MIRYLKRLKSSTFVRVKAFPMYGGIGVSAPSLHRESTDSLIYNRKIVSVVRQGGVAPTRPMIHVDVRKRSV